MQQKKITSHGHLATKGIDKGHQKQLKHLSTQNSGNCSIIYAVYSVQFRFHTALILDVSLATNCRPTFSRKTALRRLMTPPYTNQVHVKTEIDTIKKLMMTQLTLSC